MGEIYMLIRFTKKDGVLDDEEFLDIEIIGSK